jgi:CheY-like chemotaxis protein
MDREVASRAFEPFFTTKPIGEGTGLGLATVFGIVTQAQGAVTIYSEPGVGTTVRIHIPASPVEPEQPSVASAPGRSLAGVETILLVDDEEMVREPARRLLARFGYSVLDTSNADDALEIVRRHAAPIDLLLTDVAMPGRSGKELSEELLAVSPATKVLFMSGSSRNVIVRNGVLDDDVNLIEKPFSANDLLRRVRATLDGDE